MTVAVRLSDRHLKRITCRISVRTETPEGLEAFRALVRDWARDFTAAWKRLREWEQRRGDHFHRVLNTPRLRVPVHLPKRGKRRPDSPPAGCEGWEVDQGRVLDERTGTFRHVVGWTPAELLEEKAPPVRQLIPELVLVPHPAKAEMAAALGAVHDYEATKQKAPRERLINLWESGTAEEGTNCAWMEYERMIARVPDIQDADYRVLLAFAEVIEACPKPSWNGSELSFEGVACLRFKKMVGNQVVILDAFEREGWHREIGNIPLDDTRLSQAVNDLQKRLKDAPITFQRVGPKRVRWGLRRSSR